MDQSEKTTRRGRPHSGSARALSRERILEVAAERVRVEGFERLSMRELAGALDVDPASLYWHFSSKRDLLGAVLALASAEIDLSVPSEGEWQDRCFQFCESMWTQLSTQPEVIDHQWHLTPLIVNASRILIDLLTPSGLSNREILMGSQTLLWQTLGLARRSSAWPEGQPHRVVSELNPLVGAESVSGLSEDEWKEFAAAYERGEYDLFFEFAIRTTLRGLAPLVR